MRRPAFRHDGGESGSGVHLALLQHRGVSETGGAPPLRRANPAAIERHPHQAGEEGVDLW